ncbi:conserved membrane hypothetical protein [Hyella patelloides LEGE 07179]|uniref:Uncharacterized protein n=1 Tax=Hyella patelloides LEGE 07179 TaxID=945734 RepID=A0A563W424_9CYAN|nr:hypothetical protein [Hyella patelloides]VEP18387.1 conserved membrane hypothetical protein [Hyella patelloides LEGE 07179]
MIRDIFPFFFPFDKIAIAGCCLWSLALYIVLSGLKDWITEQFSRWLNFADRSFYTSVEEFEETRDTRESQNAFYASVMSIVPFFLLGFLSNWGIDVSLGSSWSISLGIMTCIGAGVYALGRQGG